MKCITAAFLCAVLSLPEQANYCSTNFQIIACDFALLGPAVSNCDHGNALFYYTSLPSLVTSKFLFPTLLQEVLSPPSKAFFPWDFPLEPVCLPPSISICTVAHTKGVRRHMLMLIQTGEK